MNIKPELIITVVLALSTGLLGWMQWRSGLKVQKADAIEKIGDAYDGLLDRLSVRIGELESRVVVLERELKQYTTYSARLSAQLVENGIVPLKMDTDPSIVNGKR